MPAEAKESLEGPEIKILTSKIGKKEKNDKVFAFAYALQHYNK